MAKRWYDVCAKNGGLYVKLGQSVNTLAHILPPEYLKYFEGLLDQAPQASFEDVKRIVEEDLGSSIEEKFHISNLSRSLPLRSLRFTEPD